MSGTTTDNAAAVTLEGLIAGDAPIAAPAADWLRDARAAAIEKARALGLPAKTDEEWRYTNPKPIIESEHTLPEPAAFEGVAPIHELAHDGSPIEHAARIVFIDGRLAPEMSDLPGQIKGLDIAPFDHTGEQAQAALLAALTTENIDAARDGFEALGAGLLTGGVVIRVGEGVSIDKPVLLVFHASGSATSRLTAPSVTVIAEENAHVRVIEDHQGDENATGLTLSRTDLRVGKAARAEHATLQREPAGRRHVSTFRIVQEADSFAHSDRILLGSALCRNNIHATLNGDHCETAFNGLFLPEHAQHHDNHIRVEHMAPDCHSRQYYRGLLADRARGVFTGRIYVKDVAQKTDAIQSNSNLLLSPNTQVTAKPQLEIYADDVRCTHGATSGRLDDDSLFYLRARGVPERVARLLLLHAFAGENVDRIAGEPFREFVRSLINDRLDTALARNA